MAAGSIKIGTSGFGYKDWLGNFYPQFCSQKDFLKYYASQFSCVELDVTFYRIPTESMVERWVEVTPEKFKFAAKFPRTVTHEGSIEERIDNAGHFVEVMRTMGDKLGPLLLQFPYSFKPEHFLILEKVVASLPDDIQLSVEIRNRKWLDGPELTDFLTGRKIALCLVDHPWMPKMRQKTADWTYIRFLGDQKKITEDFSYIRDDRDESLDWWAKLVEEYAGDMAEIYAFFNNHFSGHAPSSAHRFLDLLSRASK